MGWNSKVVGQSLHKPCLPTKEYCKTRFLLWIPSHPIHRKAVKSISKNKASLPWQRPELIVCCNEFRNDVGIPQRCTCLRWYAAKPWFDPRSRKRLWRLWACRRFEVTSTFVSQLLSSQMAPRWLLLKGRQLQDWQQQWPLLCASF